MRRQARGRLGVWCVLYEMLSGRRAFEGDDVTDTLGSVLKSDPDWRALPADLPPAIRLLIERSLVKDRRRVGDISTALFVLNEAAVLAPASSSTPAAPRRAIGWSPPLPPWASSPAPRWRPSGGRRWSPGGACSAARLVGPAGRSRPRLLLLAESVARDFARWHGGRATSVRTQVLRPSGALSFESVHSPVSRSAICPGRFSLTSRSFRQTDNRSRFSRGTGN